MQRKRMGCCVSKPKKKLRMPIYYPPLMPRQQRFCPSCKGQSSKPTYKTVERECSRCQGTGKDIGLVNQYGTFYQFPIDCKECDGKGKYTVNEKISSYCSTCFCKGYIYR